MTVCQWNWPISWPPPHWPPGRGEKKNGRHIWPNYDIKNFFQKKFKCTPCPQYWTITSTLVPLEHSRKQQNVGYTDATIGCSLKQPKIGPKVKDATPLNPSMHGLTNLYYQVMKTQNFTFFILLLIQFHTLETTMVVVFSSSGVLSTWSITTLSYTQSCYQNQKQK